MCVGSYWHSKGSSQPKVSNFNSKSIIADKNVLRFQIPMKDAIVVHENECLKNLKREALNLFRRQSFSFSHHLLHVFLQIEFHVFKHQIELLLVEYHLLQLNNISVLEIL